MNLKKITNIALLPMFFCLTGDCFAKDFLNAEQILQSLMTNYQSKSDLENRCKQLEIENKELKDILEKDRSYKESMIGKEFLDQCKANGFKIGETEYKFDENNENELLTHIIVNICNYNKSVIDELKEQLDLLNKNQMEEIAKKDAEIEEYKKIIKEAKIPEDIIVEIDENGELKVDIEIILTGHNSVDKTIFGQGTHTPCEKNEYIDGYYKEIEIKKSCNRHRKKIAAFKLSGYAQSDDQLVEYKIKIDDKGKFKLEIIDYNLGEDENGDYINVKQIYPTKRFDK